MKKHPTKLGLVGLGWPGRMHANGIKAIETGAVYAACDADASRLAEFQETFGAEKLFSDFGEMLGDPEVEAVVISLPNFLHFSYTLEALRAGKHVLCEKPPTMNAEEMRQLKSEAERRGLIYYFGRQMRFDDRAMRARAVIAEGRLGEIYFARTGWVRARGIPTGLGGWFTRKDRAGGGALIDLGVHCLDDAWFLMGCPKPVTVSGKASCRFARTLPKNAMMDVDDCAFATVRFDTGAVLHLETSWAGNLPEEFGSETTAARREKRFTTLFGSLGSLCVHPLNLVQEVGGELADVNLRHIDSPTSEELFARQMSNFLAAVRGECDPLNTAGQALELMEMLDAIYKSSDTSREVVLA